MNGVRLACGLVISLVAMGCARHPVDGPPGVPRPDADPVADTIAEIRDLDLQVQNFAARARWLPGRTEQEHRQLMHEAFTELALILPRFESPRPPGAFLQQMRIIEQARDRLATLPPDVPAEPIIDSGVRAAYGALESIRQRWFADREQIDGLRQQAWASVVELDAVRGPMHRLTAARAVGRLAALMQGMTADLTQRIIREEAGGEQRMTESE